MFSQIYLDSELVRCAGKRMSIENTKLNTF